MKHKIKSRFTPHALAVAALLAFPALSPQGAWAQGQQVNIPWKGTAPSDIGTNEFYLYNVGTGKFIMADGLWNTEPMLEFQDYGMPFTILSRQVSNDDKYLAHERGLTFPSNTTTQTLIHSGMVTTEGAEFLGCNVNGWTTSQSNTAVHGPILDTRAYYYFNVGQTRNYCWRTWEFTEVASGSGDYVLKETIHKFTGNNSSNDQQSSYYLGAVWGTNGGDVTSGQLNRTHDTYHTAYKSATSAVTADSLNYLWRFVTQKEMDDAVKAQNDASIGSFGGLNANVTHLLQDPNFDRAQESFSSHSGSPTWTVTTTVTDAVDNTTHNPRWDWTFIDAAKSNIVALASASTFTVLPTGVTYRDNTLKDQNGNGGAMGGMYNQPWNSAVFRKLEPSDGSWASHRVSESVIWDKWEEKMHLIQYEMAALEGEGEAYQTVSFTTNGRYAFTARCVTVGGDNVKGELFVAPTAGGTGVSTPILNVSSDAFKLWDVPTTAGGKGSYVPLVSSNLRWTTAARELDSLSTYLTTALFTVTGASQENPVVMRLGIRKTGSVKSVQLFDANRDLTGGDNRLPGTEVWRFYSDASYVAVDNMQLHYLGSEVPFIFDENATDVAYMTTGLTSQSGYTNGFTNRTTYIIRNAKEGKWQPIVLPVSLTTEQVRQAFGEEVQLGRLKGVGKLGTPTSPTRIDFESVRLATGGRAIEAWQYYLIKAQNPPTEAQWSETTNNEDGTTTTTQRVARGYLLGRVDYNPNSITRTKNDAQKTSETKSVTDTYFSESIYGTAYSGTGGTFDGGDQDLTVHGTWTKTTEGQHAPAHAYYVYDGTMYYLSQPQSVKGFKWWITANEGSGAKGVTFGFVAPDNTVTYIDGVSLDRPEAGATRAVYTLAGLKVADDASALSRLPKGIYITGGKKIINR